MGQKRKKNVDKGADLKPTNDVDTYVKVKVAKDIVTTSVPFGQLKALFFSDLHLKKANSWFNNGLDLQYKAIRQAFQYAVDHAVPTVIIGGDISEDHYLDGGALGILADLLCEFDGLLDIHIILGNHDVASEEHHSLLPVSRLVKGKRFKTVYVYEQPTFRRINGVPFNFLPFPFGAEARKRGLKEPAFNVAHLEWRGAVRDNGVSRIGTEGYYHKSKDRWLIGHLHTAQELEKGWVIYCGTLYQCSFGERLEKSMCLLEGTAKNLKLTRIPVALPWRLLKVSIKTQKDLSKLPKSATDLLHLKVAPGIVLPAMLPSNVIKVTGGQSKEVEMDEQPEISKSPKNLLRALMQTKFKSETPEFKNVMKRLLRSVGFSAAGLDRSKSKRAGKSKKKAA